MWGKRSLESAWARTMIALPEPATPLGRASVGEQALAWAPEALWASACRPAALPPDRAALHCWRACPAAPAARRRPAGLARSAPGASDAPLAECASEARPGPHLPEPGR